MAGGTLLFVGVTKAGDAGAHEFATHLARQSSRAVVRGLVRLDFLCSERSDVRREVISQLEDLLIEVSLESTKKASKSARAIESEIRFLTDSPRQWLLRKGERALPIPGLNRQLDKWK